MLRPGGRIGFTTIELAADLPPRERRRAVDAAPTDVTTRRPYEHLLHSARFVEVSVADVTADFLRTMLAWSHETEARYDRLVATSGREVVDDRLASWSRMIDAVERGWLLRRRYVASR